MSNPFDDLGLLPLESHEAVCLPRMPEECERALLEELRGRPGVKLVCPVSLFSPYSQPIEVTFWSLQVFLTDGEWPTVYATVGLMEKRDMRRLKNVRRYVPEKLIALLDPDSDWPSRYR